MRRKRPNVGVVEWCEQRPASTLFLSVLTLGEWRKGVQTLAASERRTALLDWLEVQLPTFFSGRILPVDSHVADCWGRLMVEAGRPIPAGDSLIGATAAQHGLRLVTRNVRDDADLGLEVVNPWSK